MKINIRERSRDFFFRNEGGKKVLNRKHTILAAFALTVLGIVISLLPSIRKSPVATAIRQSNVSLIQKGAGTNAAQLAATVAKVGGVLSHAPKSPRTMLQPLHLRYRAKQVITPGESYEKLPIGSNFIGKFASGIDTRYPEGVQVVLPYGAAHKFGGGSLPPQTILFGQSSYPGHGDRVYINFDHGLLPDGNEFKISARALSSKDYRPGVIGDYHGNTGDRMASVIGLSMISGMSDVMIQKESLGQSILPTPKANLRNGFYNGLSNVAQMEANEQANKLGQTPSYVTIDSGSDLIISLSSSYYETTE